MDISIYLLPAFILFAFLCAFIKKVNVYDGFVNGVKGVIPLLITIFPYTCAVLILSELFEVSKLSDFCAKLLEPLFNFLHIPTQLTKLILIKPLSGSGSIALLSDIYKQYGADSYIARCASCIYGASETVFYVGAVYFSNCKQKNAKSAIIIGLVSTFLTCILACFICKALSQ